MTALERHLGHDATWTVPPGGNHIWVALCDAVDERALYVEALLDDGVRRLAVAQREVRRRGRAGATGALS